MFVFYDTETTGLDKEFAQILQIALVFTDDDFNILSSKKVESRRSPWVVPSPGAMLTTGFTPDDLKNAKYSHYEMMREVNAWVHSLHLPLTFAGYNSIDYDEPVLAQNLYQNMLDPQLTTSKNDVNGQPNGIMDVMVVVKAVAAFMPGALTLNIMTASGQNPSVSLINVATQNGVSLSTDDAHDAMNDTKATVGVAKLLKKVAPQIWNHMLTLSTVDGVDAFLKNNETFAYAINSYGKMQASVMTSLVEREGSTTQALFDLKTDPAPYLNMTVDQLKDVFLLPQKERPFVLVRKNSQPILMPLDQSAAVLPAAYDETLCKARAKLLQSNKAFLANVAKASFLAKQEKEATAAAQAVMPEMMIEQPVSPDIKKAIDQWIRELHTAPDWESAEKLVDSFKVRFKDELAADPSLSRFAKFASRIVFEHAPQVLSPEKLEAMKKYVAARVLNPDTTVPYMTLAKARAELDQIEKDKTSGKGKWATVTDGQIRALKLYYTSIEKELTPAVNSNTPVVPKTADAKKKNNNGPIA